jgi:hypothetical protein
MKPNGNMDYATEMSDEDYDERKTRQPWRKDPRPTYLLLAPERTSSRMFPSACATTKNANQRTSRDILYATPSDTVPSAMEKDHDGGVILFFDCSPQGF